MITATRPQAKMSSITSSAFHPRLFLSAFAFGAFFTGTFLSKSQPKRPAGRARQLAMCYGKFFL